jgi:uncharacterized protein (DUF1919 family)
MNRILVWGTGIEYNNYFNCIKFLEQKGQMSVIGVTSDDLNMHTVIDGYPFFSKSEIPFLDFDYCVVAMREMSRMFPEAEKYNISKSRLIPLRALAIPNIDFDEYIKLKERAVSIFSSNCWAGACYHRLGLEFLSPTINMFESADDFNRLMMNLDEALHSPVKFIRYDRDANSKIDYPIGAIRVGNSDILLHFNHYTDFDDAAACWNRRKQRVNWDNIVVVSHSDSENTLYDFEKIPFEHKVIITSQSDIKTPSSLLIQKDSFSPLWRAVMDTACGRENILDLIALLNHEKKFLRVQ